MIYCRFLIYIFFIIFVSHQNLFAQDNREFKIFQFPSDMIPTIEEKKDDWNIVSSAYTIGIDQMKMFDPWDKGRHLEANPNDLDVK